MANEKKTGIYVRVGPVHLARLDGMVAAAGVPTSRSAVAGMLLTEALDGAVVETSGAADRLRLAREGAGLDKAALGKLVGLSRSAVSLVERGRQPLGGRLLAWVEGREKAAKG